ncbi:hypothetical protein BJ965_007842 [Streptomyces luteogriseus]|uniref:Uncharacterized protein n=1 Tax=Streptomyces luteogriseus TaxID=68233 RepID=A0A7W7DVQ5_9ACTN|nr:hypothetical protein [Streptomyces luteogriseus]MBB4717864.1 hypothetical protein [Streptomyces luteogriseus]
MRLPNGRRIHARPDSPPNRPRHKTCRVRSWAMNRMRVCQHCQESFELAATGRPPRYCSATCRKSAWEKRRLDEAVAIAVAKAVAAEQRRGRIRGNETRQAPENRGNETPPQATAPAGPQQTELAMPQVFRAPAPMPEGPSIRKRRRLLPPPPGAGRPGPETG